MSPIIRECQKNGIPFFILHTGQHYSFEMDKIFFDGLFLPEPDYNLDVGSGSHASQSANILMGVENVLSIEKPGVVLVQGDTNTVMAGAIAAAKIHISIGHVEAGLRSFDKTMPEEINRVITDHISDYLFVPTDEAKNNLQKEGIKEDKIIMVGNTIVDAVIQNEKISKQKIEILLKYQLERDSYILVTTHRAENVDSYERLHNILLALNKLIDKTGFPVIFPIHPRTKKMINSYNLNIGNITLINPLGYLDFLFLEKNAKIILTDSGGIQEEACIMNVPCITLRENTERPETLMVGANILSGTDPEQIIKSYSIMIKKERNWINPYGDGNAAKKIIKYLIDHYSK